MPFPTTQSIKFSDIKNLVYINESDYFIDKLSTVNKQHTTAAYSTRLLKSDYSGPAVNVRRSSDNATQDFYADVNGNLGTQFLAQGTSLDTWLGTANGYVTKMYDQTGNGRDVSQSTTANQPTIGTVHVLDAMSSAGKTAMRGAYALFRLSNTYTGPTIKIRRSSDNTLQDFYANASGVLGTALNGTGTMLASWLGNSTAYVHTWFDQSGNGFNCVQTTNGSQPVYNPYYGLIDFAQQANAYFDMGNTTGPVPTGSNPSYTLMFKHGSVNNYPSAGSIVFGGGGNSTSTHNGFGMYNTNNGSAYFNYWWNNDHSFGQYTPGNVITYTHNGTTQTAYINNVSVGTTTRTGLNVSVTQQYMGMDLRGTATTAFNGQLYYAYVMNTSVSNADRFILHQYDPQYGFTSTTYNPFKYNISYNGISTALVLSPSTVGCEYPPPGALTANTTNVTGQTYGNGTYVCSVSSSYSGSNNIAFNAFTNTSTDYWESAGNYNVNSGVNNGTYTTTTTNKGTISGDWIQIQMPTAIAVKTFSFGGNPYNTFSLARSPRKFALLGSNNGTTWKCIHYDSGITDWDSVGTDKYFVTNIDNSSLFNYFRFIVIEIGNSYTGTGVAWQNVTDVGRFKFNPATPLTRGRMQYTFLTQCNPKSQFSVICEQNVASGSVVSNARAGLLFTGSGAYFSGQSNDATINRENVGINRSYVMVCNHNLSGGASRNINLYENGILYVASTSSPSTLSVSNGIFVIGSKYNNAEYYFGIINEVIVVNHMLTPNEAYLYSSPSNNVEIKNRLMPKLKPKQSIQFEPDINTTGIRSDFTIKCTTRELSNLRHDSPLSTWGDFSQGTYANRPNFRRAGWTNGPLGGPTNDQPFVEFNASSSHFIDAGSRTFNIASNGGFTAIACVKLRSPLNNNCRIFDFGNGQNTNNILCGLYSTGIYFYIFNSTDVYNLVDTGYIPGLDQWFVVCCRYQHSNTYMSITIDNITWTGATVAAKTDRTVNNCYIGRSQWSGDPYANFYMSGFYAYDKFLTDAETAAIGSYLMHQNVYGVPRSITTDYTNVTTIGKPYVRPVYNSIHLSSNPISAIPRNYAFFASTYTDAVFLDDVPGLPLSISFWFSTNGWGGWYQTMLSLTEYTRTNAIIQLDYDGANDRLNYSFALPTQWTTYTYSVARSTWYNVVITLGTDYVMKMYINGTLQNTANGSSLSVTLGRSRLVIGSNGDTANRGYYGRLSDVRVYDYVLRQDEITDIATGPSTTNTSLIVTNGLLAHLDLANVNSYSGSGTTITDLTGNGYNYTLVNSPPYSVTDVGGVLSFTAASSQYLQSPNFGTTLRTAVTFEVWVYPTGNGVIMNEKGTSNNADNIWFCTVMELVNGNIYVKKWSLTTLNLGAYTANAWHQIVLTHSGGVVKGYLNGVFITSVSGTIATTADPIYYHIGANSTITNMGNGGYFSGRLSNVKFYNRALTDAEVLQNYNVIAARYPYYRNNFQLSYNTPDQYLVNKTNWTSLMTFVQNGNYAGATVDSDPVYTTKQIGTSSVGGSLNQYYHNTAIQNYQSFTCSFEIATTNAFADGIYFFCGGTSPQGTTVNTQYYNNYGNNVNAYMVSFQTYGSAAYFKPGIALFSNYSNVVQNSSISQLAYVPDTQWSNMGIYVPVTIKYNKGSVDTWTVNVNGKDIIRYDDPNNTTWLASAGSYWGIGSYVGGATSNHFIRCVELSYVPVNTNLSLGSLIGGGISVGSLRNSSVPGLIPGFTWKIYDGYNVNIDTIPYRQIGRSSNTSNIARYTNGYMPASSTASAHSIYAEGWFRANKTGNWTFSTTNTGGLSEIYINGTLLTSGTATTTSMTAGTFYRINFRYAKSTGTGTGSFTFTPPGGSSSSDWSNYVFSSTGTSSLFPAESAKVIKDLTNTNTDGIYYIRINNTGTAVYCLMNDCYNGGGWMLLMKGTRGTTFSYSANYWTTTNTLNQDDLTRVDGDAKYDTFNYGYIKDVMAIFPDVPSKSYTNVLGKNGGSLNLQEGWCWKVDNWNGSSKTTALAGFQNSRDVLACPDPTVFSGYSSSVFSAQSGVKRHVFGGGTHISASHNARWGFIWNNESDYLTCDTSCGIGLSANSYSAGDGVTFAGALSSTGLNRSMRFELWGR